MSEVIKFAAAYIRVSDDRQDEYSPDSQLKLVREYAKKKRRNVRKKLLTINSQLKISYGDNQIR